MTFAGKTVLVTGASTGIGKAMAQRLMKQNCNLVLIARRAELIEQYLHESPASCLAVGSSRRTPAKRGELTTNHPLPVSPSAQQGGRLVEGEASQPLVLRCDVSKKEAVAAAYDQIKQKFGEVDIAILNSGIGKNVTVETYNSKDAEDTFGANVFGIIYWVEQLLPDFLKRKNGIIAAVSSLADNRGFSGSGFYCASKAAATTYLEGLRVELKPHNIKVITIRPGFVRTPMTDQNNFKMPLLMEPEKAAEIILRGIEKEKRVIQFPWQIYLATRLIGALPGTVYEWLAGKAKI